MQALVCAGRAACINGVEKEKNLPIKAACEPSFPSNGIHTETVSDAAYTVLCNSHHVCLDKKTSS